MSNEKYFEYEAAEAKAACELNRKRNRAVSLAAITSLMAITAVCSGCKSAEAKSEESLSESSSISASSMAEAVVASYNAKVEAGVSYTASDLGALVVDEKKVIPVSASTNPESSLIDSSSVESEEVTFEFKDGDTEKIFKELGDDKVSLIMTAADGTMEEWSLTVTVEDTTAPVFEGIEDIEMTEGDKLPDLKAGITVSDNYDEVLDFTAELDPAAKESKYAAGEYVITYKAADSSGNEAEEKAKLIIKEKPEEDKEKDKEEKEDEKPAGEETETETDEEVRSDDGGSEQSPTTTTEAPATTQPPQTEPPKTTTTEPPKTTQPPQTTVQCNDGWIQGYGDMGWGYDAYYAYNPATGEYIILG